MEVLTFRGALYEEIRKRAGSKVACREISFGSGRHYLRDWNLPI